MAWKFYYFTHILKDESWCNDRLRKITENILTLKTTVKIYLNYEILRTEIWNMSPEIFQKEKIRRQFSIVTYPSHILVSRSQTFFFSYIGMGRKMVWWT